MSNELLLILSLFIYFATMLIFFKVFGKIGLFLWVILATLFANIEVLLQINAFGLDMTLGNVLFASSFLATDVLSERYGKDQARIGARLGVTTTITYIVFSKFWLMFSPNEYDFSYQAMQTLFDPVLRIALAGVVVYYICQRIDIFLYHLIWKSTTKITNDKKKFLWVRNNGSTIVTQLVNNVLFTFFAFATIEIGPLYIEGMVSEVSVLFSIFLTGWILMVLIAILDTPICYLCRIMRVNEVSE